MRYEVWDFGRPGAPTLLGWALLSQKIMSYHPDLVIWDFGFNDLAMKPSKVGQKLRQPNQLVNGLSKLAANPKLNDLKISQYAFRRMFQIDQAPGLEDWLNVNRHMVSFAKKHQLPVIMLRHGNVGIRPASYRSLIKEDAPIFFYDTTAIVERVEATPEQVEVFWSRPNYLDEIHATRKEVGNNSRAIFRTDALHYNRFGHLAIARMLLKNISTMIEQKTLRPRTYE
jgi:hypothetical protein